MILIPEQKLKALLDYALESMTKEYLYRLFGSLQFSDYNYYENAVQILLQRVDNPRKVECHIFFRKDRANLPTIHLALNSETFSNEGNGLGYDSSFTTDSQLEDGQTVNTTSRRYATRFNIVFTSNNTFEVLIMYHTIKAFLQGNYQWLEYNGLTNPKLSGNDIILTDYLAPPDIYSRALMLDCEYDFTAPALEPNDDGGVNDIFFGVNCNNIS